MTTAVYFHPEIFLHDFAANHGAKQTDRLFQICSAVLALPLIVPIVAEPATDEQILRNHTADFIDSLVQRSPKAKGGYYRIDNETILNQHTWRAMQFSAGAACHAVDKVLNNQVTNAFCPIYAGHHAQFRYAAGFCFINSVAIAAQHALARGVKRIAILDIDSRSGNGTVLSFVDEPRVLFAETYQPGYPGNFMPGVRPAHILRERCNSRQQFLDAWSALLPYIAAFEPELILVSAGFEAHESDPMAVIGLRDEDYTWIGEQIMKITPRIVACLEGGYEVETTSRCARLFVQAMAQSHD